ncbi:MAG: restriction endonuclease subunit S [Saprospiraceae bacterium]|nr:restriction endonuclease subunit S [Saprospiraceae bacterium]
MNNRTKLLKDEKVQWKTLGEVAELKRGTTITAKSKTEGNIPVISGGQKPAYYNGEFNRDGETITVAGSGAYAGFVMYWNEPIFVSDAFSIKANQEIVLPRYIYHFLLSIQSQIHDLKSGGGVPHVYAKDVARFKIPIPPLHIQQEIVAILDKFTELTAELTARKKQYDYYREQLLSVDDKGLINGVKAEWKTLGEVGELVRGNGLPKSDFTETGIPAIHYGQIYTYYKTHTTETISFVSPETAEKLQKVNYGDVVITNTSENIEDVGKSLVYLGQEQAVTGGHATIFKPSNEILGKYFAYFTQTEIFASQKRKLAKGTKVIDVSAKDLAKIKIPIPPLSEQELIVSILDKFDTLTTSISEGLPKEIELRQKQYAYYREQLLDFPKNNIES